MVCLKALYKDFKDMPQELYREAMEAASIFIDGGSKPKATKKPAVMDWEQDAGLIIPAVNKVAGTEVRSLEYLHWWTFLGYYQEVGEGTYATVVSIRDKEHEGRNLKSGSGSS